jgi:transposase
MIIIGCDYHPGFQQIAFVDSETGEVNERRLEHRGEAEQFYRDLAAGGRKVRVGMEASGHARWFERLLGELQIEVWMGDAAEIRTKRVRKQKTDRQDAQLLLRLLLEDRFPRIWVPSGENRDLRQLLWHRHRLVQMRTRIMNQLHVVALNEGMRRKKALWRPAGRAQLEALVLARWASRRRQDLLEVLDQLTPKIQELTQALEQEVEKRPVARRLRTHPGGGSADGAGLRVSHRNPGTFWLWQANRQLCGLGSVRRVQRRPATTGTYQQARQLSAALPAGGSGSGHGPHRPRLAPPVSALGPASRTTDRQDRHGPETRGSSVLDVAQGMGLRAVEKVRFARGTARKSPGCVSDHRRNDWASRSPSQGSSK